MKCGFNKGNSLPLSNEVISQTCFSQRKRIFISSGGGFSNLQTDCEEIIQSIQMSIIQFMVCPGERWGKWYIKTIRWVQ